MFAGLDADLGCKLSRTEMCSALNNRAARVFARLEMSRDRVVSIYECRKISGHYRMHCPNM